MAPCILILALVYSLQMPDSTFDIMAWIFVCPGLIGSVLCRGLTPQQHAAALERQNQQNTAAVPAEGEEYAQLASIEDTNDIEAQSENVQLMLGRVDPGTAALAETVADPPPYDEEEPKNSGDDVHTKMTTLKRLLDDGLITAAEFQQKKDAMMGAL